MNLLADILLVDDNAVQAMTRRAILSRLGRKIIVADSAMQALEMLDFSEMQNSPGLVITDHLMPGMDGPQFVTILRERLPQIPVLVLSGLPDVETQYDHLDVVFRMKPLAPEQLISLVQCLLNEPMSRTA
ncbi:response regulator [Paracidobacterium acidisoli]|uniref:Response regulator n=1 Tax=Paracidobacterium acidisoli TaxID=2303751 RepID=A0A372ITK7_9BACT|nr:response regulator [Paracidobacterium acidisoli]MBT9329690.1 response regulator [Paracidobacterium acidisoli]